WPEHDCAKTPGISESPEPILTSGGYRDSVNAVKRIRMHSDLPWVFLSHVEPNTLKNIETCGFLLGKLSPTDDYVVTEVCLDMTILNVLNVVLSFTFRRKLGQQMNVMFDLMEMKLSENT
ncbi:hypothetical protein BVRB_031870, partial [Beta vulgaris subsp. vulgaris]